MSTRCNVVLVYEYGFEQYYRHTDGYPETTGKDLAGIVALLNSSGGLLMNARLPEIYEHDGTNRIDLHGDIEYLYIVSGPAGGYRLYCVDVYGWEDKHPDKPPVCESGIREIAGFCTPEFEMELPSAPVRRAAPAATKPKGRAAEDRLRALKERYDEALQILSEAESLLSLYNDDGYYKLVNRGTELLDHHIKEADEFANYAQERINTSNKIVAFACAWDRVPASEIRKLGAKTQPKGGASKFDPKAFKKRFDEAFLALCDTDDLNGSWRYSALVRRGAELIWDHREEFDQFDRLRMSSTFSERDTAAFTCAWDKVPVSDLRKWAAEMKPETKPKKKPAPKPKGESGAKAPRKEYTVVDEKGTILGKFSSKEKTKRFIAEKRTEGLRPAYRTSDAPARKSAPNRKAISKNSYRNGGNAARRHRP